MKLLQMLILGLFYVVVSPRSANSKKQLDANPHKIKYKAIKNVAVRKRVKSESSRSLLVQKTLMKMAPLSML